MATLTFILSGGLRVAREVPETSTKPSDPVVQPSPEPEPEAKVEKTILEKAVETVEEVVKPKRRGRPKKKPAASE